MSDYDEAKESYKQYCITTGFEFEIIDNLIQAADMEIEDLQTMYSLCNHDRALMQTEMARISEEKKDA